MSLRRLALAGGLSVLASAAAAAVAVPAELIEALRSEPQVSVIVEIDSSAIDRQAAQERARTPRRTDDEAALGRRAARYASLKQQWRRSIDRPDLALLRDYRHLPLEARQVRSEAALRALAASPAVRALHVDRLHQHTLAQSLPLVSSPIVSSAGVRGSGSTVAVIDDGINLTHSAFGGCTAVGTPAACRIAAAESFVETPSSSNAHGSNVAAIVLGVAPDARIASLGVFGSSGASTSSVLAAIDWAIQNRNSLGIVAINMSLGDGSHFTSACSSSATNPFVTPIANARNAGISVVAASGNNAYNNGSLVPGISRPACTPGAVSVGAVYDSALGARTWFSGLAAQCIDSSTAADQVACFSNTSATLRLLAPGALVAAAGFSYAGTSQATPHVAGALAVLRSAYPADSTDGSEGRLLANGTPVLDPRTGTTTPRLNLKAAYNAGAQASLSVTAQGPANPAPGLVSTYTVTVSNAGPQAAFDVVAELALPAGYTAAGVPAACSVMAGGVRCSAASLASGSAVAYGIEVQVEAAAAPGNFAVTLSSGTADPSAADNTGTLAVAPGGAASGDVPALPPPMVALLGAWLLWRLRAAPRFSGGSGSGGTRPPSAAPTRQH